MDWLPMVLIISADYSLAALLAGVAGALELVTRHPAQPSKPLLTSTGRAYIAINAFAGALALFLGVVYGLLPDVTDPATTTQQHTTAVLAAGAGSLVILRSSVLSVRVDGKDVNFGPSFFLERILAILQREVERSLAPTYEAIALRARRHGYDKIKRLVVPSIRSAFQEAADQQLITDKIEQLDAKPDMADSEKAAELAQVLFAIAGEYLHVVFDELDVNFDPTLPTTADPDARAWEGWLEQIPEEE